MKRMIGISAGAMLIALSATAMADDAVPNLVGQWTVEAEGMVMKLDDRAEPRVVAVQSVQAIKIQDGVSFSGSEVSQKAQGTNLDSDTERFAGVIGPDGKTISMVDENGFRDCTLQSATKITCFYRHIGPDRAIVTTNTWTKQGG